MPQLFDLIKWAQMLLRINRALYAVASVFLVISAAGAVFYLYGGLPSGLHAFVDNHVPKWVYGIFVAICAAVAIGCYDGAQTQSQRVQHLQQQARDEELKNQEEAKRRMAEDERARQVQMEREAQQLADEVKSVARYPGSTLTIEAASTPLSILTLQLLLCVSGYDTKMDGLFGPKTEAAVREAQASLKIKVDGKVGKETWDALVDKIISSGKEKALLERLRKNIPGHNDVAAGPQSAAVVQEKLGLQPGTDVPPTGKGP